MMKFWEYMEIKSMYLWYNSGVNEKSHKQNHIFRRSFLFIFISLGNRLAIHKLYCVLTFALKCVSRISDAQRFWHCICTDLILCTSKIAKTKKREREITYRDKIYICIDIFHLQLVPEILKNIVPFLQKNLFNRPHSERNWYYRFHFKSRIKIIFLYSHFLRLSFKNSHTYYKFQRSNFLLCRSKIAKIAKGEKANEIAKARTAHSVLIY